MTKDGAKRDAGDRPSRSALVLIVLMVTVITPLTVVVFRINDLPRPGPLLHPPGTWNTARRPALPANGHTFVAVAAGDYRVGAEDADRNPPRTVTLAAFEIATHETTNAQFARFIDATGYRTDAERDGWAYTFRPGLEDWVWDKTPGATWRAPNGPGTPVPDDFLEHPVTQISWRDANAYCRWAGVRLPTVEEWEVAARAGTATRFPWGDTFAPAADPTRANVWDIGDHTATDAPRDGFTFTAPVGSFAPNAWGLYDVVGNVFEYCLPPTTGGVEAGERGRDGGPKAFGRGGSWWCSPTTCDYFNLADVGRIVEYGSLSNQGFRVARTPEAAPPNAHRTAPPNAPDAAPSTGAITEP